MASKIASKIKRVNEIVTMLEKGMERKAILQQLAKTCKSSTRTLDNEIKEAKLILHERNNHKEAIRLEQTTDTLKDAVNEAILSDLELEGILCKIASGNMEVEQIFDGTPILRGVTPNEVTNAVKTIFLKRGSNAPTKINQTIQGGISILENDPLENDKDNNGNT
jgi:DNA-binding FrmR family transcriptional regulator